MTLDDQVRMAAFDWLEKQTMFYGRVLDWSLLRKGFPFQNKQIHIIQQAGIFKPSILNIPISISTSPKNPYQDKVDHLHEFLNEDATIEYKYQGNNPDRWDNAGLRKAMIEQKPLIYFLGMTTARYRVFWPVYVINDSPDTLTFAVSINKCTELSGFTVEDNDPGKGYKIVEVKKRIHQDKFRENVIAAYKCTCAFCNLRHFELLDAAHIIPDSEPQSKPIVSNGLSLCKLHHSAYDQYFVGVTPDYKINVREDILEEEDGPMLQHGLKELHNQKILTPSQKVLKPNPDFLDWKYQKYKAAI